MEERQTPFQRMICVVSSMINSIPKTTSRRTYHFASVQKCLPRCASMFSIPPQPLFTRRAMLADRGHALQIYLLPVRIGSVNGRATTQFTYERMRQLLVCVRDGSDSCTYLYLVRLRTRTLRLCCCRVVRVERSEIGLSDLVTGVWVVKPGMPDGHYCPRLSSNAS